MKHGKNPFARERFTGVKLAANAVVLATFAAAWLTFWATNHDDGETAEQPATATPTQALPTPTLAPGQTPTATPTGGPPTPTATPTRASRAS